MKVKELIESLQKCDPDVRVYAEYELTESFRGAAMVKKVSKYGTSVLIVT